VILPTVASLPLLMVYHVTYGSTTVVVPYALQGAFGPTLDLGMW
jgi:UDP-N-acetylglucosamine--dolichyl-phosphate N-acetylglucosaminephosphotransferase